MTRFGTILPGKKLNPWTPGMEEYLPDNSDVVIVGDLIGNTYGVLTLTDWHNKVNDKWWVHKDNIQEKG